MWTLLLAAIAAGTPVPLAIGSTAPAFELKDPQGVVVRLDEPPSSATVVAFLGTECPLANLYAARLDEISRTFKQVTVLGIFSNQQDSIAEIAHFGKTHNLSIPLLKDVGNVVADQFGAERTPEVFLLDAEKKVRYWGRIDDQYGIGYARNRPIRRDLRIAIEEVLAGKPISQPKVASAGCLIGRRQTPKEGAKVTFSKQVVRIFQKHCQECHREGQIAPFSLVRYEDVVGWGGMIGEVVREQRMPPWHANPQYGHFSNDCRLSEEEKEQIYAWVRDGEPEGDPRDLPSPIDWPLGWRIPKPDVVLTMPRAFRVPAHGVVDYRHAVIETEFTEDKWIQCAEARPGAPAVVHHIIVFIRSPDGAPRGHGLGSRWLCATAPGARPMQLPKGYAKRIPAGSKLVLQLHYTPNGKEVLDQSSVGLVFADPKDVKRYVQTHDPGQFAFRIPPNCPDYKMVATHRFSEDTLLLAFLPHMHVRGKAFRYEAAYPDGKREILLDVPKYDFGWQNTYVLAEPKKVPAGTRMICTAHYDNSAENLSNPDPNASVIFGEQTWEEMMFGFFESARADEDLSRPAGPTVPRTKRFLEMARAGGLEPDTRLRELAASALDSPSQFAAFFEAVRQVLPQADRLCVTTVESGTFTVQQAAQDQRIRSAFALAGFQRPATGFELAKIAAQTTVTLLGDLAGSKGFDLASMARIFSSSAHVPIRVAGKPATLNFWSIDKNAFPKEAEPLLRSLAEQVEHHPRGG